MSDLTKLTLSDALDGMAKGDFSSVELTEAHIAKSSVSLRQHMNPPLRPI